MIVDLWRCARAAERVTVCRECKEAAPVYCNERISQRGCGCGWRRETGSFSDDAAHGPPLRVALHRDWSYRDMGYRQFWPELTVLSSTKYLDLIR